ncbi:MAG: PorT family protein [Calditrichaeota bacterium]|nr:PorT family protein [Calditrichota bacterium]
MTTLTRRTFASRWSLVLCAVVALGALSKSAVWAGDRYALEFSIGPVWASHWSPREKPPGTEVLVDWRSGLCLSLSGTARLARFATAELGLTYAEKGAQHTVRARSFPFGDMLLTYDFRYIELPATVRTYWVRFGSARLYTYGGAYVGLALGNSYNFYNAEKGSATRKLDEVQQGDVGFVSGFGWEVKIGRFSLLAKYRYSMGFVDLTLDTDPVYIPEFRGVDFPVIELRNFTHAFLVGVRWTMR